MIYVYLVCGDWGSNRVLLMAVGGPRAGLWCLYCYGFSSVITVPKDQYVTRQ